jgi:hypothetical protein
MNSNFNCSYMAMSSLTYILGFSVRFFQPVYSVKEYYEIKITSKSFAQKFELKWSLGGPLSKLCVTPPFSINFRCQIENQVSDYRLLGASSLNSSPLKPLSQMNRNLVGSIYGRSSIKNAHFVPIYLQTWLPQEILVSDWLISKNLLLWNRLAKWSETW